jgi:hypothetical protein
MPLEDTSPAVKFASRSHQDLTEELARQLAAAGSVDAGRQLHLDQEVADVDAAGHLLLFLAEPLSSLCFSNTVAPVCSFRSVRMLLSLTYILPFSTPGELKEEVFIRAPGGTEHLA